MDYNRICEMVAERTGKEVKLTEVTKNNGVTHTGIQFVGAGIMPTIYLDNFGDDKTDEEIATKIAELLVEHRNDLNINAETLGSREYILANVFGQLVNGNQDFTGVPHTQFLDMAIVYRARVNAGNDGVASYKITNDLLRHAGISENELADNATRNTKEMYGGYQIFDMFGMNIISNDTKVNGAIAITDKEFMDSVAAKLGNDLLVLPSSTHECIVMPIVPEMDLNYCVSMVREINRDVVNPEEVLSDNAYRYTNGKLSIIEPEEDNN